MLKLNALLPIHCHNEAISHIFFSLCRDWHHGQIQTRMVVPSCIPSCRGSNLVEGIPSSLKWLYYRIPNAPRSAAEQRFLRDLDQYDAAYLWPDTSPDTLRKVKQRQVPIFLERINCYTGKAKQILDDAYTRLGLQPRHTITAATIHQEHQEVELADFIFCPSPEVKQSFQAAGVPEAKLLLTSYGWSRERFLNTSADRRLSEAVTILFVGSICVRKGAHLLLRAWERSGIKGRLMLCGQIEPAIRETCHAILDRPDVVHAAYNREIASAYQEADIFAFPSLEEGSPLVMYEAMAHGLAIVTSPMGAGGVVEDGRNGIVLAADAADAWVETLRTLARLPDLRYQLGVAAQQTAQAYTWDQVAARRNSMMVEKLQPTASAPIA